MSPIPAVLESTSWILTRASSGEASNSTDVLQVVCAWPVSGQYGVGSRALYYALVAACILLRKNEPIRNACLSIALLIPAVAALHGIVLAVVHIPGAVDMDIYGSFQLCSIGLLVATVTVKQSRTYFYDPARNTIFFWSGLILAGLLSLTVEMYRITGTPCPYDNFGNPISSNPDLFPYGNAQCDITCSVAEGPHSPMRGGAGNDIYVVPVPDKLTFATGTLLTAACCVPGLLLLVMIWLDILDRNSYSEQENEATGKRKEVRPWLKLVRKSFELPMFGAAVLAILVIGEGNFFSEEVRKHTEPVANVGQWAPIIATSLAVLGSLYVLVANAVDQEKKYMDEEEEQKSIKQAMEIKQKEAADSADETRKPKDKPGLIRCSDEEKRNSNEIEIANGASHVERNSTEVAKDDEKDVVGDSQGGEHVLDEAINNHDAVSTNRSTLKHCYCLHYHDDRSWPRSQHLSTGSSALGHATQDDQIASRASSESKEAARQIDQTQKTGQDDKDSCPCYCLHYHSINEGGNRHLRTAANGAYTGVSDGGQKSKAFPCPSYCRCTHYHSAFGNALVKRSIRISLSPDTPRAKNEDVSGLSSGPQEGNDELAERQLGNVEQQSTSDVVSIVNVNIDRASVNVTLPEACHCTHFHDISPNERLLNEYAPYSANSIVRKFARLLVKPSNYMGKLAEGRRDHTDLQKGEAGKFPAVPAEQFRHDKLSRIETGYAARKTSGAERSRSRASSMRSTDAGAEAGPSSPQSPTRPHRRDTLGVGDRPPPLRISPTRDSFSQDITRMRSESGPHTAQSTLNASVLIHAESQGQTPEADQFMERGRALSTDHSDPPQTPSIWVTDANIDASLYPPGSAPGSRPPSPTTSLPPS